MTVAIVLIARQTGFFTNLRLSSCLFPQNPALRPRYYSNSHISNRYTDKCHHFSTIATIATVAGIHPNLLTRSNPADLFVPAPLHHHISQTSHMTVAIVLIAHQTGFFANLRLSSCLFPQNPALRPLYYSNSHISNRCGYPPELAYPIEPC